MRHLELLSRLAQPNAAKIVLLVLDGVGDLATPSQPLTALQKARKPHLDALAARSSLGRIVPVATGITPGSGPGHLALFGYDPRESRFDIGRGILEALGLGLSLEPGDVAARGNFATANAAGELSDRRAGRIPTSECIRVCAKLNQALSGLSDSDAQVSVVPGEAHRFVLLLRGPGLEPAIDDTDPQQLGVPPLAARETAPGGVKAAALVRRAVALMENAIADEPKANRVLLRGFSRLPDLPQLPELYKMRCGAFAGYPLYRGVAAACGMAVIPCGKRIGEILDQVALHWQAFDFFFLHVKQTDQAGEDGDIDTKAAAIEEVDALLPRLLALGPEVVAVTGDHSTPAPMAAHSFHPVPLMVASPIAFVDETTAFDEHQAIRGHLGTFPSRELIGLLLAHAGRLEKFGA
ncbi:MAG: 2,3-bisphosphoglycerate-independent phosphoglycerate mutase [Thermoanaerobaculia bacterium]|jgi:2,3-bisphosphoglycerate-independent phosphoglycerate mutase|nr:2,3-bisphosphoglycerate-independent phosphoglycerate mutase [Thermoanaerobaculia bacterium]MBP9822680.1 2,3-bisphosphoglycerate-independent phosphoglycerate mutase [Thermoanaerobaculia bacterium]